jgi:predicted alpha/beta hydrolase family esterase
MADQFHYSRGFLILHGWMGSGQDHWQTWLSHRLRARGERVLYPNLPDADHPHLSRWLETLGDQMAGLAEVREKVVICHSLAVLLWLHFTQTRPQIVIDRLLLVAPPGPSARVPEIASFFPIPIDPKAFRRVLRDPNHARLVCSPGDPYCPEVAARLFGPLGIPVDIFPAEAGHINVDTGYGQWNAVEDWCLTGTPLTCPTDTYLRTGEEPQPISSSVTGQPE